MKNHRSAAFTLIEYMIVVAIIGILITIAVPGFFKAHTQSRQRICQENLTKIDGAKDAWTQQHLLDSGATVTVAQLIKAEFLKEGLVCPEGGGSYTINPIGKDPACSFKGHDLNGLTPKTAAKTAASTSATQSVSATAESPLVTAFLKTKRFDKGGWYRVAIMEGLRMGKQFSGVVYATDDFTEGVILDVALPNEVITHLQKIEEEKNYFWEATVDREAWMGDMILQKGGTFTSIRPPTSSISGEEFTGRKEDGHILHARVEQAQVILRRIKAVDPAIETLEIVKVF